LTYQIGYNRRGPFHGLEMTGDEVVKKRCGTGARPSRNKELLGSGAQKQFGGIAKGGKKLRWAGQGKRKRTHFLLRKNECF